MSSADRREPALNIPLPVLALIGAMLAIHVLRGALGEEEGALVAIALALLPPRLTAATELPGAEILPPAVLGLITYPLVQPSFTALVLDAVFIAIFGTVVARRFGAFRFALITLAGTLAGGAAYTLLQPAALVPLIGGGVLVGVFAGAATRFVFPSDMFRTDASGLARMRALTLRETFTSRQALAFVALYLLPKLLFLAFGDASSARATADLLVPMVGFAVGLLTFDWIDPVGERTGLSGTPRAPFDRRR